MNASVRMPTGVRDLPESRGPSREIPSRCKREEADLGACDGQLRKGHGIEEPGLDFDTSEGRLCHLLELDDVFALPWRISSMGLRVLLCCFAWGALHQKKSFRRAGCVFAS